MWDAIIVGAGPAGSALATLLARLGHAVLLLDSARFPREKLCGEYINAGCLPILEELGLRGEVERSGQPVRGMRISAPGGLWFTATYPAGHHGLAIRRSKLDHVLLQQARNHGVACLEAFRVEHLLTESGRVRGVIGRRKNREPETFPARIVIGADGRNSVVARRLGLFRWRSSRRKIALCVHYPGLEFWGQYAEVYLGRRGYGILNPLQNGDTNVGVVMEQQDFAPAGGGLDRLFREVLRTIPDLETRLRCGQPVEPVRALGPLAHDAARISGDGALLVGDAAGFYDPFTGEGVYMALRGAQLAAEVAHHALAAGDCSARFLKRYDALRAEEFRSRFWLEAAIQQIIRRPSLARFAAARLNSSRPAATRLMSVLGAVAPPRGLLGADFLKDLLVHA